MAEKGKKARRHARFFKNKSAAHKAAKGHWGTHTQYVRKAKGGYKLYSYPK